MLAKWQGFDMHDAYADWADSAKDLTLAQINHGIELSKKCEHPPNQSEFIAMCRQYIPPQMLKIEHRLSKEQRKKNQERIQELAKSLTRR